MTTDSAPAVQSQRMRTATVAQRDEVPRLEYRGVCVCGRGIYIYIYIYNIIYIYIYTIYIIFLKYIYKIYIRYLYNIYIAPAALLLSG